MSDIIALTGPIGAGKDTAGEYIATRLKAVLFPLSLPLKELALARGLPVTRENLIQLGREVAEEHGEDYLARCALLTPAKIIVVAGG